MRKILSIVLMSAMILSLVLPVIAAPAQGSDFTFDTATGTITKYIGSANDVEIPEKIGGVTVTAIGDEAFRGCTNLIRVTIPASVTKIGDRAFLECPGLTVYLKHLDANTITLIGTNLFDLSYGLVTYERANIIYPRNAVNFSTPVWRGYIAYPERANLPELEVKLDKNTVKAGKNFNVSVAFKETVNGNTAILTYRYDPAKFKYEGFSPANGVTTLIEDDSNYGIVQITVMVPKYDMKYFGDVTFSAKKDIKFNNEQNKISVEVECVVKEGSVKSMGFTKGSTPTVGTHSYTLIDLSDVIDMFGFTNAEPEWETEYKNYDFNENGVIDIQDIVYVAKLIGAPESDDNDPDRRWGYVMSSYGADVTLADGSLATSYKVWDIKTGTVEIIYDVSPHGRIPYKAGTHISYKTVGFNMPNTHQIIAAVNPFGERFQIIGNPVATPMLMTQASPKTEEEIAEDMLVALKSFRKAFNEAAKWEDGAITTTAWNSRMKSDTVSGVTVNSAIYTTVIDTVLNAAGTAGILANIDGDVRMFGNDAELATFADDIAYAMAANPTYAGNIHSASVKAAVKQLDGYLDTLKMVDPSFLGAQYDKALAVVNAVKALLKAFDDADAAYYSITTSTSNPAELDNMANAIETENLIAITPNNATTQQVKDAILESFTKAICEGLYDSTLPTAALRNATKFNLVAIVGDVATIRNETDTKEYRFSFANFTAPRVYTLNWTGTTEIGMCQVTGVLYVQVSTYNSATTTWSAFADLGTGRIDFSGINVKFTNDPATHKPLDGRLVNLGDVAGAEGFLLNDEGTYRTRTAFGMVDMLNGINQPSSSDGLMYNFEQATNILTLSDYHETVTNSASTTLADSTLICIYDVNHPLTDVNSLRLADFKTLMLAIHNTNPIVGAIKSAVLVSNSANHSEVLYVGIDPSVLKDEQLAEYKYAMNLKYIPISGSSELTTVIINSIIARGDSETKLAGNAYYYDAINKIAYAKAASGITYSSYGLFIPYIEIKAESGTYKKVASYTKVGNDTKGKLLSDTNELTYDFVDVRHIASNGFVDNIGTADWTARTATSKGTVYVVPYDTNGGFAIIVVVD